MRIDRITPEVVELAPKPLQPSVLYISPKYRVAVHLCCCGCGEKVVTPLTPAEWRLQLANGIASLYPSIGNWEMPCQSHYWIRGNRVLWAGSMSAKEIDLVHARDLADLDALLRRANASADQETGEAAPVPTKPNWIVRLWHWFFG